MNPDASLREVLRYLLSSDGHEAEEAQTKQQALQKLRMTSFDVVLTGAAELDVTRSSPCPLVEVDGEATPVLRVCEEPVSPSEELNRFMVNPFDLTSIRQAFDAIRQIAAGACGNAH